MMPTERISYLNGMPMEIILRPGRRGDLALARRIYFETMRWIIERLFGWDEAREIRNFAAQFMLEEVAVIIADGDPVGWMQTQEQAESIFLKQLYVALPHQRRGIGGVVLTRLIDTAVATGKPLVLGVVKINAAARRFYEHHGFRVTHEDEYKFYMRHDPAIGPPG